MSHLVAVLRLVIPAVWLGLIIGLSFIETPLKFLAPGITTPLGLGIGRLVFTALSIAGWVLLLVLAGLGVAPRRENRAGWMLIAGLAATAAVQSFVIRPLLSARSDVIIAGGDPGSPRCTMATSPLSSCWLACWWGTSCTQPWRSGRTRSRVRWNCDKVC